MAKCNKHLWLDTNDGSFDQRCINCGIKRMQGVMAMPNIEPSINVNINMNPSVDINEVINKMNRSLQKAIMEG